MKSPPRRSPLRPRRYRMTEKDRTRLFLIRDHTNVLNAILDKYATVLAVAKRIGPYTEDAKLVDTSAKKINNALRELIP